MRFRAPKGSNLGAGQSVTQNSASIDPARDLRTWHQTGVRPTAGAARSAGAGDGTVAAFVAERCAPQVSGSQIDRLVQRDPWAVAAIPPQPALPFTPRP